MIFFLTFTRRDEVIWEYVGIDGSIILEWILNTDREWNGFLLLRIRSNVEFLCTK